MTLIDTPYIRNAIPAVVLMSAVGAFFLSPLLNYADFDLLILGGLALGIGLGLGWLELANGNSKWLDWFYFAVAGIGLCILGAAFSGASIRAGKIERQCFIIENEMMKPKPRRSDLADLFQALGCRATGNVAPAFPPDTPTLKSARAPLGGQPLATSEARANQVSTK